MLTVDDEKETIHLYVVREEQPSPSVVPLVLSLFTLLSLFALGLLTPYRQPVLRAVLRTPAVILPLQTFTARVPIIPTGIKTYPATDAHGYLTFTNGSVIGQSIPEGFTVDDVATDRAVYVPPATANTFGIATVATHMLVAGSDLPALAINAVIGSSLFVRNLSPFTGGHPAYSVKFITSNDHRAALSEARNMLASEVIGLHYPCSEGVSGVSTMTVTWRCLFVTYRLPSYMHVSALHLSGKNLVVAVWFVERPKPIWAK